MEVLTDKTLEPIEQMLDRLNVASVFGQPTSEGEATIIPVAALSYGFGYGFGGAQQQEGGGGGGGGIASPRGYLHITREGVTYHPINNDTLLGAMGIFTGIWSILWVTLTIISVARAVAQVRSKNLTA